MDNDLLIAAIDAAEQSSYSSEGDSQLATDRALAIDLYNGKDLDPPPEGRSKVTDRSVFETIQWILPSLCRIFANGDDVVELPPVGPEDEKAAKQESQYLNYIILQKNNWFETFITWATDAMLTKNGYCLAYNELRQTTDVEEYERQTEQGIALLMDDKDWQVEVTKQYPDPDYVPQPAQELQPGERVQILNQHDPAHVSGVIAGSEDGAYAVVIDGMEQMGPHKWYAASELQRIDRPAMQPPPMLFNATLTRVQPERKMCIKVLPPERCKISYRTPSFRINEECPYFEYYDYKTLSDLNADGFEVPDTIPDDWAIDEEEDLARDQYDEQGQRQEHNEPDASMTRYRVRMIWLLFDANEDGIAERMYVVRIGKHILHAKQCTRIPVASLVAIPNSHRHIATSIADIVGEIQRIKQAILRQGLDNLYLANNPRTFISDKINLDDALVSRPGGIVRGENGAIFGQDIAPLVSPFVFPQAMEGLEYMDQVRENRTGTNRYFTGIDQNAMNKTATGIQQLSTMAAQRVEQIARIMACGVEDLFSIVHELILRGGHRKEVVKLSNDWVEIDPAQWRKRTDFRISVGYAAGNKDAMVARLMMIAQMQEKALAGGLPIVTPENAYETAIELTKASDFSAPNRFWTNPKDVPPKGPPQPDVTVMAAEQENTKRTLGAKQMDVEQKERDSERDFAIKRFEIETKANEAREVERMRLESAHSLEDRRFGNQAGLKQIEGQQTAQMKEREHQLKQQPALEIAGQVQQMAEELKSALTDMRESLSIVLTAKRQVRRGANGKAEGVDILGPEGAVIASQKIERGADGKVTGLG
jgi:hypothetical protein